MMGDPMARAAPCSTCGHPAEEHLDFHWRYEHNGGSVCDHDFPEPRACPCPRLHIELDAATRPETPTLMERERILRDAARRYLAGEIDYRTMTALRRRLDAPPEGAGEG
jgi:hypothetical protein